MRIALAGLGTVGAAVLRLLHAPNDFITARAGQELRVMAVSARNSQKTRACDLSGIDWVTDARDLALRGDVDVVIEVIGGAEGVARDVVDSAMRTGKHVVTANKALIAKHGRALAILAEQSHAQLSFEAAVCGGLPILKLVREGLAASPIIALRGILNGTCNFILTQMEQKGVDFATALAAAQQQGYAEADPAGDFDGHDTAHKTAILTALAFGHPPDLDAVFIEGITAITPLDMQDAAARGGRIKLLGMINRSAAGDVIQRVQPVFVPYDNRLAQVMGAMNGVEVVCENSGGLFIQGAGAGGDATASAVVADLIDLARGHRYAPFGRSARE